MERSSNLARLSPSLKQRSNNNKNSTTRRKVANRRSCWYGGAATWKVSCLFVVAIGCVISFMWQQQRLGTDFDWNRYYYQYSDYVASMFNEYTNKDQQHDQESSCISSAGDGENSHVASSTAANHICRQWQGRGTAASLWTAHRDEILQASRHPLDLKHQHDAWMRALFDLVARPAQLQRAWRTLPRPHHITRILDIVQKRRAFLERQQLENPGHAGLDPPGAAPPLRIAVFGGSVAEGTKCEWLPDVILQKCPSNITWPTEIRGNVCAWPFRWQRLLDHFLGPRVVQVHNLAVGGTSSTLALPILKYWLYPRDSDLLLGGAGPDIIINAYSANDNLFSWDHDANGTATMDNFYQALERTQEFCRTALLSKPCHASNVQPILGFVSEYQGNLNELLLAEDIRADTVRLLSEYYEFFDLSPASVVRQLVLVDADETLLSPSWYSPRRRRQPKNTPLERTKDSHYGMPGHVYTAWTMAYAALSMVLDHCDDMDDDEDNHDYFDALQELDKDASAIVSAMKRFPPPSVTRDLMTIDGENHIHHHQNRFNVHNGIPMKWRQQALAAQREENEYCRTASKTQSPCPFAFVATPTGTTRTKVDLSKYITRFRIKNADGDGWAGENNLRYGWQNKIGLIASQPGGTLHLRLQNIQQTIRHVIVQSLKSYGEEWKDSEAQFNITITDGNTTQGEPHDDDNLAEKTTSFTIQGFHDMNASIALPFALDLGNNSASIGQTVDVKITLIGGKKFKIIAMMLCSR